MAQDNKKLYDAFLNYSLFAGVNGAGKTSIYKSTYYEQNKDEKRISTDEMVARTGS
ncbi:hypothetical protein CNEO3_1130005 [Clostridium neonatale]|nr:hypothetical protein CNEO3_1130005 [Clostridium neonatale]CAI3701634.1 hypothetical protein CNEO3_730024 [Clostridium neonatale]